LLFFTEMTAGRFSASAEVSVGFATAAEDDAGVNSGASARSCMASGAFGCSRRRSGVGLARISWPIAGAPHCGIGWNCILSCAAYILYRSRGGRRVACSRNGTLN